MIDRAALLVMKREIRRVVKKIKAMSIEELRDPPLDEKPPVTPRETKSGEQGKT